MKKLMAGICIVLALILLFPFPVRQKDGGSVEWNAVLYSVTDVHRIKPTPSSVWEDNFEEGIIIEILGREVFRCVESRWP